MDDPTWYLIVAIISCVLYENLFKKFFVCENVLFFPDDESLCRSTIEPIIMGTIGETRVNCHRNCHRIHGNTGDPNSSLLELFKLLSKATRKIDLCVYLVTSDLIAQFLIRLKKEKKIKIRLITDSGGDEAMKVNNQKVRLEQEGIEVKTNSSVQDGALMHNKFAIIDSDIVLCGSFNWTTTAIMKNHEAVVVTSSWIIVNKFTDKFEEMWASNKFRFSPNYIRYHSAQENLLRVLWRKIQSNFFS